MKFQSCPAFEMLFNRLCLSVFCYYCCWFFFRFLTPEFFYALVYARACVCACDNLPV